MISFWWFLNLLLWLSINVLIPEFEGHRTFEMFSVTTACTIFKAPFRLADLPQQTNIKTWKRTPWWVISIDVLNFFHQTLEKGLSKISAAKPPATWRSVWFGRGKVEIHQKIDSWCEVWLRCFHYYCCEGFLRFMMLRDSVRSQACNRMYNITYNIYNVTLTFKSTCSCWKNTTLLPSPPFLLSKNMQTNHIQLVCGGNLSLTSNRGVFCWKLQQICFWAIQLLLFQARWIFSPR